MQGFPRHRADTVRRSNDKDAFRGPGSCACQADRPCIRLAHPTRAEAIGVCADPDRVATMPGPVSLRSGRFLMSNSKVKSMAKQEAEKDKKDKPKAKPAQGPQEQAKKDKPKAKPSAEEAANKELAAAAEKEKAKAAPRPPADPRLKYMKKFHGKFLPRGPLRDRLKALMDR